MTLNEQTTFITDGARPAIDGAPQFPPGALLLGRYRLAAPVGRGGMGIVYRADDVKIGQRVALKFLSTELENDPERVARLIAEVRLGRRVAHPNVCRLYDIAEVGSHHFIVMELVEGEDLASLLERIGRLSNAEALGVARDVCAGLAAAHDQGIVHRDLKPANVMIDNRGRARITDFGLAATIDDRPQRRVIMGTRGYMAPEQARGEKPSTATDVWALGVLLYEMFTGRPAFEVTSIFDLAYNPPPPPSTFVPDIDPRIEALISRCLSTDPAGRPPSARAVLEALPQPDILDAAVAARETPPPEVVAAAGAIGGLAPPAALALFFATLLCTAVAVWLFMRAAPGRLMAQLPPPRVMRERVLNLADRLAPGRDRQLREWFGYQPRDERTSWSPESAMRFWYRTTDAPSHERSIAFDDPPQTDAGAFSIETDGAGHLRRFRYAPRVAERTPLTSGDLFAAAGLDPSRFVPIAAPPIPLPPVPADRVAAWQAQGTKTLVLLGTSRGVPVFFEVRGDSQAPPPQRGEDVALIIFICVLAFIAVGAALLARRNVNRGQGDARGALRVALFSAVTWIASWALIASPQKILEGIAYGVLAGVLIWLSYMALEPYVRRRWPRMLISWSRLLQGRFADPLVGRDLLIGLTAAAVLRLIMFFAAGLAGEESPMSAYTYAGLRRIAGELLYDPWLAVVEVLAILFLLYAAALIVRSRLAALVVVIALLSAIFVAAGGTTAIGIVGVALALYRFGLFAGVATCYGLFLQAEMKTLDVTRWYALSSVAAAVITALLLVWAVAHATKSPARGR